MLESGRAYNGGYDGYGRRDPATSIPDWAPATNDWTPNATSMFGGCLQSLTGASAQSWTVDVTGRILRPAPYPGSGSDPAWSPLLD